MVIPFCKEKCAVTLEFDEANSESVYGIFEFWLLEAKRKFIVVRETQSYFSWHLQAFILTMLDYLCLPLVNPGPLSKLLLVIAEARLVLIKI
jgi:hypothetical protein